MQENFTELLEDHITTQEKKRGKGPGCDPDKEEAASAGEGGSKSSRFSLRSLMAQKEEYKSIDDKDMPALGRSCVFSGIWWSGVFTSASYASVLLQTAFKSGKICSLFCGRNVLNKKNCCMWNVECRMSNELLNN